ncbi:thermonuclease family protein [Geminicoccus flavidas]|uniref:thermonuclease family protein n=1 Tax=Geminicoccus flavidas TaxID=2506407 RepID=UPI0013570388|nr:thermonuclease family protein [Geminicoccus flavidas]
MVAFLALTLGASATNEALATDLATVRGQARVIDGDTIAVGNKVIRLLDIDAPVLAQKCDGHRSSRACGKASADALAAKVGTAAVECVPAQRDDYDRILARCSVGDEDLSTWSVSSGWSFAFVRYSARLVAEEQAARARGLGIWAADEVQAPWDYRARRWDVAAQEAPEGYPIKGNISKSGERIYHVPWTGQFHDRTKIDTCKGERWFCSVQEAQAAGWRASYR